jgi:hypothetical protein
MPSMRRLVSLSVPAIVGVGGTRPTQPQRAFTLIELLTVIVTSASPAPAPVWSRIILLLEPPLPDGDTNAGVGNWSDASYVTFWRVRSGLFFARTTYHPGEAAVFVRMDGSVGKSRDLKKESRQLGDYGVPVRTP